ncbi:MAG: 2-oxoacid:ferredoxin oxidoreductase subunit beta [Nitrososphaerota archaeon]|nr:2-oxoacid:ferredoxin oxidoreductase subunit beta [Nitrososphaerota archaeon]
MEETLAHPLEKYLRTEKLPHMWCPGCGIGTVVQAFLRAVDELKIEQDKVVAVSGIGCTGRIPQYIKFDGAHVLHGRAIPVALGIKLARPDLKVVVFGGDGDLASIGGNHLMHAARRNADLIVIMVNNFIYGLTGGQVAPTTPKEATTYTSPYGPDSKPLDAVKLVSAAGGTFVARWSTAYPVLLKESIKRAFSHRGFSFIEVISQCPELFGRINNFKSTYEIYQKIKKVGTIRRGISPYDAKYDWNSEISLGEFVNFEAPSYYDQLREIIEKPKGVKE